MTGSYRPEQTEDGMMRGENLPRQRRPLAKSGRMGEIYAFAKKAASSDSTILIYGESGTGKEVFAHYIHKNSARGAVSFIPVNCAAIPPELMESEFFGYAQGAFTGASKNGKPGLFEIAGGGTLFLDEIGELPLALQSKLLRVLETGDIMRVGGSKVISTDVRIVAATNRDLYGMTRTGAFREDLYYRLHIIPIYLPALRERREDIESLACQILADFNAKYGYNKFFSAATLTYFREYSWPGNIRELKNVVERLVIISQARELHISREHLFRQVETGRTEKAFSALDYGANYRQAVDAFERAYIEETLSRCQGNVTVASKMLGLHRSSIYKKLQEP
ncbi:MAG: sigma 54-interacting transcriptional regulator [Peptococcaceae bacterium]|jgi:transcriptional regulator with PAS, ATPase and Fis domain|nr:sigma 54-interacting transcriptional regulator [Peptococcaceae bacterium]